ncbi:hypothetical protein GMRT_12385 [Giardia muris]|uniref:Uncharacterized protein n=1 Tax=Giardia muris TaxID=5742 RepID=A0A4Z1SUH9_GIAMU|nr:hypothetical protein GMRT_12385 [Giardia muris]|eukprot:TNJ27258.1 hypothetical protein GMRT_12385 [Giardia muris]
MLRLCACAANARRYQDACIDAAPERAEVGTSMATMDKTCAISPASAFTSSVPLSTLSCLSSLPDMTPMRVLPERVATGLSQRETDQIISLLCAYLNCSVTVREAAMPLELELVHDKGILLEMDQSLARLDGIGNEFLRSPYFPPFITGIRDTPLGKVGTWEDLEKLSANRYGIALDTETLTRMLSNYVCCHWSDALGAQLYSAVAKMTLAQEGEAPRELGQGIINQFSCGTVKRIVLGVSSALAIQMPLLYAFLDTVQTIFGRGA